MLDIRFRQIQASRTKLFCLFVSAPPGVMNVNFGLVDLFNYDKISKLLKPIEKEIISMSHFELDISKQSQFEDAIGESGTLVKTG